MPSKKKVLCFGNEYINEDSLAKKIVKELKIPGVEFILCNGAGDILEHDLKDVYIMDVMSGINDVVLLEDINRLKENRLITLHDFDVAYILKLLKEINHIKKIKIIGIPKSGDKKEIKDKVTKILLNKNQWFQ